jgi:hypothetical protein
VWHTLKKENRYSVLVGKSEENKLLGVSINRREDNIKMNFKKTKMKNVDWLICLSTRISSWLCK